MYSIKCPECKSDDVFFDPIMHNYICNNCDEIFEGDENEER